MININNINHINNPKTIKKKKSSSSSGFDDLLDSQEVSADAKSPVMSTPHVMNLLMINEYETPKNNYEIKEKSERLLIELDFLRKEILVQNITESRLLAIHQAAENLERNLVEDEKLKEIIEDILLLAEVELAKFQRKSDQ